MDLSDLTIYELADLPEEEAWRGVHASLAAFPRLSEIFNNDDLANLIARRAGGSSRLLLRLVRSDHEMWREVFEAFDLLGPLAAQSFTEKVRRDRRGNEESWLTELRFAAWLKRGGVDVTIEPAVNDGLAEFLAQTDPPTVWEIKSPLDAEAQRAEAEIMHELQGELRRLPVPVVLSVDLRDDDTLRALSLEQLSRSRSQPPKARKPRFKPGDGKRIAADILEWIKGVDPATLPASAIFGNLTVEASPIDGEHGFFGSSSYGIDMGSDYHVYRVRNIIKSATGQLPKEGGGVILVDGSASEAIDETAVACACFGREVKRVIRGALVEDRPMNGLFSPHKHTRVSAVGFWTGRLIHDSGESGVTMFHNPFARVPLADDWLPDRTVRQARVYQSGGDIFIAAPLPNGEMEI